MELHFIHWFLKQNNRSNHNIQLPEEFTSTHNYCIPLKHKSPVSHLHKHAGHYGSASNCNPEEHVHSSFDAFTGLRTFTGCPEKGMPR